MKRFFIVLVVMAVAFSACSSDNGNDDPFRTVEYTYIFNQGNYTEQNGEISVYEEDAHTTINRVFHQVNGYELASTIMDVTAIKTGLGYLLCANPDKLVPVAMIGLGALSQGVTNGIDNPRSMAASMQSLCVANAGKDFTVDEYYNYTYTNGSLSVYDVQTTEFISNVHIGNNVQGVAVDNEQKAYVTHDGGVTMVDLYGMKIIDTYKDEVYTGAPKQIIYLPQNNSLAISYPYQGIVLVEPGTFRCLNRFNGPVDYDGILYVSNDNELYTISTEYNSDYTVKSSKVYNVSQRTGDYTVIYSGHHISGFAVIPFTGHFIVAESNDFTTNSSILILDESGEIIDTQASGIGAFKFLFCSYITQ